MRKVRVVEEAPVHVIVDSMPAGGSGLTDAELRASPVVVDLGANNDVTVTSSALPAGAATAANQTTANTSLSTLAGAVAGTEVQVDVLSMPVVTTRETQSGTAAVTSVNDTASSTTLLASNANRLGATIHNDSTAILYVKFGTTASSTDYTVRMVAQAYYEVPFQYTGRIDGIWASDASGAARITELT